MTVLNKALFLSFVYVLFSSCGNNTSSTAGQQKDSTLKAKSSDTLAARVDLHAPFDSILHIDSLENSSLKRWISFYKKKYPDFDLHDFKLQKCEYSTSLVVNDADMSPEALDLYKNLLVYSPDGKRFIDLDSYNFLLEKDKKGNIVARGGDPETEVALQDPAAHTRTRLSYTGMETIIDDVAWIGNNKIAIVYLEADDKSKTMIPAIQILDLRTNNSSFFSSGLKIEDKSAGDYTNKVRRKNIKVI